MATDCPVRHGEATVVIGSNVVAKGPVSHECRRVGGSASHPTVHLDCGPPELTASSTRPTMARILTTNSSWRLTMDIGELNYGTLTLLVLGSWVYCLLSEEWKSNGK